VKNWFARNPTPPPDGPVISGNFPPQNCFFRLICGSIKMQAYCSPVFGTRAPVKNVFTVGGVRFVRDVTVPLPVWVKPASVTEGAVVRGDRTFRTTESLEGFNGDFPYSPLR